MPVINRKSPRLPRTKPSPRKGRIVTASSNTTRVEEIEGDAILASLMAPETATAICEAEKGLYICTRMIHIDETHIAHHSDGTVALAWKVVRS